MAELSPNTLILVVSFDQGGRVNDLRFVGRYRISSYTLVQYVSVDALACCCRVVGGRRHTPYTYQSKYLTINIYF